jgi:TonB-linked SusC/RagA family outer membrane protein
MHFCFAGSPFHGRNADNQGFGFVREANRHRTNHKTVLRAVKLTSVLLFIICLHVSAHTTAQKLTISLKNGSLESLFATLEQSTGFTVFYNAMDLKSARPITIEVKDASIEEVLQLSLKGQALTYFIQERTIFIKRETSKSATDELFIGDVPPPGIRGIVQSEAGTPLAGATVYLRKLKKVAVTDVAGQFVLTNVPDGQYEVEISFVGYQNFVTIITVADLQASLTAKLKQSISQLDETVVKGYYTTTDRLNTGDVTTVKGEDIQKQPVTDPILALEGRVPGLNIQQVSGAPGAYSTVQIRGQNSIANGNDPLYIVDGVPFTSVSLSSQDISGGALNYGNFSSNFVGGGISPFNALNPADIESITVLKDADATAIYGSRGANGVILITTKRGKAGDTRFDVSLYSGGGQIDRMMPMMNTKQYLAMIAESYRNDGLAVPNINTNPLDNNYWIDGFWDTTRYTNWQKVLVGNPANFTNLQSSLSGGNANTQFIISGGYSKQGTAFIGNYSDDKASAHLNVTHSSTNQRFHLQAGANFVYDYNDLPGADFTSSVILPPDAPALYDKYGNLNWQIRNGTYTFYNPVAATYEHFKGITNNLISNLNVAYLILPGLQMKSSFGFNHDEMNQVQIIPSTSMPPPENTIITQRSNNLATTTLNSWIIEPQLNYQDKIGNGRLEALAGATFQQKTLVSQAEYYYGFINDALISNPLAAAYNQPEGAENTLYRYDAIYGRLNYNWEDKYLVNITARRDGSSRFGPSKKFGNFGSVGAAWIFSKEPFFADHLSWLSFGKLRASYGTTGNDQIGDYQYLSTYSVTSSTYQGYTGLFPTGLSNPYFAWELDKKIEGGLQLGFIKDRILLSLSYYRNRTGNQLVGEALPRVTGFSGIQANLPAIVQNTGVEFTLNTTNIKTRNFSWTTAINFTAPNNKLVAFPNIQSFAGYSTTYVIGKSLSIKEVYRYTGVNPQTGLYTFATKNANGVPSYPQDLVTTKPITQKLYGGVDNQISYKGFSLDIFFQYVNQWGYDYRQSLVPPGISVFNGVANEPTAVLNRWQKAGNVTGTQRFGTNSTTYNAYQLLQFSDGTITNSSFLRLKNIALSYQLPTNWKTKLRLQNARIYLQCQNLLTVTKYLGTDPETAGLNLPPMRMVTAGIQVSL